MRLLLILPFFLIACAPADHEPETITCSWQADPVEVQYPDGVTRKSDVFLCSNGCTTYSYVNNANIRFSTCD